MHKPEVHNVLQRRQRRTDPRPQATCRENLEKFGLLIPEICVRTNRETDRQTDTLIRILRSLTGGEVISQSVNHWNWETNDYHILQYCYNCTCSTDVITYVVKQSVACMFVPMCPDNNAWINDPVSWFISTSSRVKSRINVTSQKLKSQDRRKISN